MQNASSPQQEHSVRRAGVRTEPSPLLNSATCSTACRRLARTMHPSLTRRIHPDVQENPSGRRNIQRMPISLLRKGNVRNDVLFHSAPGQTHGQSGAFLLNGQDTRIVGPVSTGDWHFFGIFFGCVILARSGGVFSPKCFNFKHLGRPAGRLYRTGSPPGGLRGRSERIAGREGFPRYPPRGIGTI